MAIFGDFRAMFKLHGDFWQFLVNFGRFLSFMAILGDFSEFWAIFKLHGDFWRFLVNFGRFFNFLAIFGDF